MNGYGGVDLTPPKPAPLKIEVTFEPAGFLHNGNLDCAKAVAQTVKDYFSSNLGIDVDVDGVPYQESSRRQRTRIYLEIPRRMEDLRK